MKFLAWVLLALVLIPAESASEPNRCILGGQPKDELQVQFRNHKTHSNP